MPFQCCNGLSYNSHFDKSSSHNLLLPGARVVVEISENCSHELLLSPLNQEHLFNKLHSCRRTSTLHLRLGIGTDQTLEDIQELLVRIVSSMGVGKSLFNLLERKQQTMLSRIFSPYSSSILRLREFLKLDRNMHFLTAQRKSGQMNSIYFILKMFQKDGCQCRSLLVLCICYPKYGGLQSGSMDSRPANDVTLPSA